MMAYYETNRQVIHLSKAKRCSDQADHLFPLPPRLKPSCWPSIIENTWFAKAFGLWRVQGGALALLRMS